LIVRFNLLVVLCDDGRHLEAEQALQGVQELTERLGNALDLVRYGWLQARINAGLARAIAGLPGPEGHPRGLRHRAAFL
jgi:hypothetical protein